MALTPPPPRLAPLLLLVAFLAVEGGVDPSSISVSAPLNVGIKALNLSPEQLIMASIPWEGMDQPGMHRAGSFKREPWETNTDSAQHQPFGHYGVIPPRPPPFIPGPADASSSPGAPATWMRTVKMPPLPAMCPAYYVRGW